MALPRLERYVFILLVTCYNLENQRYRSLGELTGSVNAREKRAASTLQNLSDYESEAVVHITTPSDWNILQMILNDLRLPFHSAATNSEITHINITTVCSSNMATNMTGFQCTCEESFAWSYNNCLKYGACDGVTGNTCGCVNEFPALMPSQEYCQPNTSQTVPTTTTLVPSTTAPVSTTTPLSTTTTPFPAPTTPLPTTTSPVPATPMSTTTSIPSTSIMATTKEYEITIDREYDKSFNNPDNPFFINISKAINEEAIKNKLKAELKSFRKGSTIAQYVVTAPSFEDNIIKALTSGIFDTISKIYPMISVATENLAFKPEDGFYGEKVTVKCGPPPDLFPDWEAEWTRDNKRITEDERHQISTENNTSILTVSNFISPDNGEFECRLKRKKDNSYFRQRSKGTFKLTEKPSIRVSPVQQSVKCEGQTIQLICTVNEPYRVKFRDPLTNGSNSIMIPVTVPNTCNEEQKKLFTCEVEGYSQFKQTITLELSERTNTCENEVFGNAPEKQLVIVPCRKDEIGNKSAICRNGSFQDIKDTCIFRPIKELLDQSQLLTPLTLPEFLVDLSRVTSNNNDQVAQSANNVKAVVEILNNIANAPSLKNITISRNSMKDILIIVGVLTIDNAKESWNTLNNNTRNISNTEAPSISSLLLQSLETITTRLINGTFEIDTPSIILNRTTFTDFFSTDFNSSVVIEIPEADGEKTITLMIFASLDNVLPAIDEDISLSREINGRVVLAQSSGDINNISFTFDLINDTLRNPKCVFWNFSLFDGLGGWDDEGCKFVSNENETVTCNCNHLTSFSILMSPYSPTDPALVLITYIGVGLSMGSLVICLIIEAAIWRKIRKNNTSYLRHVSIVNIALSLLIANICFIIGAAISKAENVNTSACTAATFFIHFFYLAMFFWMLASALLLLYRTVRVFDGGFSTSMLAIGFALGYGAPLIIAIITIAVTAPDKKYINQNRVCWLNWYQSKALLAFMIPALSIVLINLIVLIVVLYKIVRRRVRADAAQAGERHVLAVIARSLAVLMPFFGLTWGLGVGTMTDPENKGIHIAFAFFNSLQGFFILVFGILLDKKVRSEIAALSKSYRSSRSGTRSASAANSSSSSSSSPSSSNLLGFLKRRRQRGGYNLSSSASTDSQSSGNT